MTDNAARREELMGYLAKAAEDANASDLFIVPYAPVYKKENAALVPLGELCTNEDTRALVEEIYTLAGRGERFQDFLRSGDDDFSLSAKGVNARFRVNTYRQRGSLAAVMRVVPFGIPDWQERHIDPRVMDLAEETRGMVLITGAAGMGKSTTLACIIDRINKTRSGHIVTLEDPIEYLHRNDKCIVSQREIGLDSKDYLSALRACLRQAPDVVLLGEMRDPETIRTAMTAAETGHLVLATLHTDGAAKTIDRIIDAFPGGQQEQIRAQLSMVLEAVVCQKLLPGKNGGQVPAYEIMRRTDSIATMIRDNKTRQIDNDIASGGELGMIRMDKYIQNLYAAGQITAGTAVQFAEDQEKMRRKLGGG